MQIKVNGKMRELPYPMTVKEFLNSEDLLGRGGMAVAVNGSVVRQNDWELRLLHEGDDLLIINAAYGG
ncbi:MAG: sulfur carrier protein ThiS [Bacteroidales bacterium]|nr:sulfur carrier protein ThiS [Bacteroidales bacterium]